VFDAVAISVIFPPGSVPIFSLVKDSSRHNSFLLLLVFACTVARICFCGTGGVSSGFSSGRVCVLCFVFFVAPGLFGDLGTAG